jgi:nicotinamide phosphoribosyltransferase
VIQDTAKERYKMNNIITKEDSYKLNHWNMYPVGTQYVKSYFESRKGAQFEYTPFVGLQLIMMEHLEGKVVTREKIEWAAKLSAVHFGNPSYFNRAMWEHILNVHDGRLPIRIRAVPEGTPVPVNNVLMTVENTDPVCAPLTNALESLLTHVWYPSTVCALSRATKQMIKFFLDETAESDGGLAFMLHDFGYRGATSDASARVGGLAHIVNFMGTDTVPAMEAAVEYYGASLDGLAYSVAATEHSIMTSLGEAGEFEIVEQLLKEYPKGILSVVADSYNIYNFVKVIGSRFKEQILKRDGVFVVRPDSITPTHKTPEELVVWILDQLSNDFGYTNNIKGYKVLNSKVRVLWSDGINKDGIEKILSFAKLYRYSAENLVFGMGGGLLQKVNRDTQRFAFKSCAQCRDGIWYDIYKKPLDMSKASKRGHLKLVRDGNALTTVQTTVGDYENDELVMVFENGIITKKYTFDEVRKNAAL